MRKKLLNAFKFFLLNSVVRRWNFIIYLSRNSRQSILRFCGAHVGERVWISNDVYFDNNLEYLTIGNDVILSPNVTLLFHKRDLSEMTDKTRYNRQPFKMGRIVIHDNAFVGMGALVMPGVTIHEGGGVASGAVVTKDVPAWTIVAGNPAKPIMKIKSGDNEKDT